MDVKNHIIEAVMEKFVELSNNKYASNVMEKVVIQCTQNQREKITEQLLNSKDK